MIKNKALALILLCTAFILSSAFAEDESRNLMEFLNQRHHQVSQQFPESGAARFFAYFYDSNGSHLGVREILRLANSNLGEHRADLVYRFFYLRLAAEVEYIGNDEIRLQHFESDFFDKPAGHGVAHYLESLYDHDRYLKSRGHHTPEEMEHSLKRMDPIIANLPAAGVPALLNGIEAHAPLYRLFNKERAMNMVKKIDEYAATKNFGWRLTSEYRRISRLRAKFLDLAGVAGVQKLKSCTGFLLGIVK
jgi:hypothetical protein